MAGRLHHAFAARQTPDAHVQKAADMCAQYEQDEQQHQKGRAKQSTVEIDRTLFAFSRRRPKE
jgi:hypothetical protein